MQVTTAFAIYFLPVPPHDVRILDKFNTNLIQKTINNMFVTSYMCMCDLSTTNMYMILIIMILIIYNKGRVAIAYPAAPEPTLKF